MIRFQMRRTEIRLEFAFFAAAALLMAFDGTGAAMWGIIACFLHEGAHIAAMLLRRKPPEKIRFYGGGIKAVSVRCCNDVFVLAAGCAANFAAFALVYPFFPSGNAAVFAVANLLVGSVNLLPLGANDGARLLEGAVLRLYPPEKALAVMRVCETVASAASAAAVFLLLLSGYVSIFAVAAAVISLTAERFLHGF